MRRRQRRAYVALAVLLVLYGTAFLVGVLMLAWLADWLVPAITGEIVYGLGIDKLLR